MQIAKQPHPFQYFLLTEESFEFMVYVNILSMVTVFLERQSSELNNKKAIQTAIKIPLTHCPAHCKGLFFNILK